MKNIFNFLLCSQPTLKKLIMELKIAFFIVMISVSNVFGENTYSQMIKVSLRMENKPLEMVMDEIEKQSEFYFIFNQKQIDVNRIVSIETNNKLITDILPELFNSTNVNYAILDRKILLTTDPLDNSSLATISGNELQQKQLTGIVTDKNAKPLPGVNVVISGTALGALTDIDGKYIIDLPPDAKSLRFSFIGMQSQEISIGKLSQINVTMVESSVGLEEVVVIGYGTQKKVNLTGSVGTAKPELLESRPVTNVSQSLQGIVAGLNITQGGSNGSLENTPTINIRGIATIGQGSSGKPLILIDGAEGDINSLNPQDIDNISVLKDAAASSIYGSRAPFGVILITTKKGKIGKPQITISSRFGWNSPVLLPQVLDSYTWALYMNLANNNSGGGDFIPPEAMQRIKDYQDGKLDPSNVMPPDPNSPTHWDNLNIFPNANVDWFNTKYKSSALSMENLVSVGGGTEQLSYYISGSALNQDGLLKMAEDNFKRKNVTASFTIKLLDWASLDYTGRFSRENYERPTWHDAYFDYHGYSSWPITPQYDPNGFLFRYDEWSSTMDIDGGRYNTQNDNISQRFNLMLEPIKGWKIINDFHYNISDNFQHTDSQTVYNHDIYGQPYVCYGTNYVTEVSSRNNYFNNSIYTEYSRVFGAHNIKVLAGFQSELNEYRDLSAQRQGIMAPAQPVLNITSGVDITGKTQPPIISGQYTDWSTGGYFGRINYDYKGRYLIEGNLRYDASSRWREENRWNLFPSVSLGWNVARENFWKNIEKYVNVLKIRGSYGELGNQNTTSIYPTYVTQPISIAGGTWLVNGAKPNSASAPSLISSTQTWETVRTWNMGIDISFLDNRLTSSFDYFNRFTDNMIGPAPELPAILGTTVPRTNNTDLKTYGFELDIEWHDRIDNGLGYNIHFILADSKTKITRYPNPTGVLTQYYEGQMMGEIWGYQTIGIAKTDEEMNAYLATLDQGGQNALGANWKAGDIMYQDLNGDKKIDNGANTISNHGDLTIIGNSLPRYTFGLDLSADFKGFDVRAFFQGVLKGNYWPSYDGHFWGESTNIWHSNWFTENIDVFRNDQASPLGVNLDSYYPRPLLDYKNKEVQSKYLQPTSYLRLKNLQVGYTIPQAITEKIAIRTLRIYMSAENILTFSKISKMFDPETIGGGWGGTGVYPLSKIYSAGVSINF
jgi:TonB-linked SusC/RagA family outer membrane protein